MQRPQLTRVVLYGRTRQQQPPVDTCSTLQRLQYLADDLFFSRWPSSMVTSWNQGRVRQYLDVGDEHLVRGAQHDVELDTTASWGSKTRG